MKRVRSLALLLIVVLTLVLPIAACRDKGETSSFYVSRASRTPLTASVAVPIGDYTFEAFLNRGVIKVSVRDGDAVRYGALDKEGRVILPAVYSALSMEGDFFLASGNLETTLYNVFALDGTPIRAANIPLTITDIGGGYVAITEGRDSFLYDSKGQDVLPGSRLDKTYRYTSCGDFLVAESDSTHSLFVFHSLTSEILLKFFGSETTTYSSVYLGRNDFLILKEEKIYGEENCTYAIAKTDGYEYYKQSLWKYTIGVEDPHRVDFSLPISAIENRYSYGLTAEDREEYPIAGDRLVLRYYVTEDKKTDGTQRYYLADHSLREIARMPEDVTPLVVMTDGAGATASPSGAIYLLSDNLSVLAEIKDAPYQSVLFSGKVVTASKVVDGVRRIGGYDKSGRLVIPFEYSYISEFVGDKAVATKGDKAYVIDTSGSARYVGDYAFPYYWDGFYEVWQGGAVGLVSWDGATLLSASFTGIKGVKRYGGEVFVALSVADRTEVYRLF